MARKQSLRSLAAFVLLSTLLLSTPAVQAAKKLRWQLKPGDQFTVEVQQQSDEVTTIGDESTQAPRLLFMSLSWAVDPQSSDEKIIITQAARQLRLEVDAPGAGELKYDSDMAKPADGPLKELDDLLRPFIGAEFRQTMNDRGQITDIDVPNEALRGLEKNRLLKEYFSGQAFRETMMKAAPVLPEQAIEKGFAWTVATDHKTPLGKMKMESIYIYEGEQQRDGRTLDKFRSEIKLSFIAGTGSDGVTVKIADQDSTGTLYFDAAAGYFVESSLQQNIGLEISAGTENVVQRLKHSTRMLIKPAADPR